MTTTRKRPVHEERLGRVRAALWENDSQAAGPRYSVTFSRLYKDAAGQWQDSASFARDDLPLLQKVADRAHSWLYERPREAGEHDQGEE